MSHSRFNVFLASDHAGFTLKSALCDWLRTKDLDVHDLGCHVDSVTVDYPDYSLKLAQKMIPRLGKPWQDCNDYGVLVCRSGCGMCISANRYRKIRAAVCSNREVVTLARQHNNINVLCLGQDLVSQEAAKEMIEVFLSTQFLGGRHANRLSKIDDYCLSSGNA